jgi:hypothetical protein
VEALKAPDTREKLRAAGVEVAAGGAQELAGRIGRESEMWRGVIEKAKIEMPQ